MSGRYAYRQQHDVMAWRDLGSAFLEGDFRRLARRAAAADGFPAPPDDVAISQTFQQWTDDQEPCLVPCDETEADVVTLTARWEA